MQTTPSLFAIGARYIQFCWADRGLFAMAFGFGMFASVCLAKIPQLLTQITLAFSTSTETELPSAMQQGAMRILLAYHIAHCLSAAVRGRWFSRLIDRIHARVSETALCTGLMERPVWQLEQIPLLGDRVTHELDTYAHQWTLNANVTVRSLVALCLMIGFMGYQSPRLTGLTLGLLMIRVSLFRAYERSYQKQCDAVTRCKEQLHRIMREYLTHVMSIRLLGREHDYRNQHQCIYATLATEKDKEAMQYATFVFVSMMLDKSVMLFTLYASWVWRIDPVRMTYVLAYQGVVLEQVQALIDVYRSMLASLEPYRRVHAILGQLGDTISPETEIADKFPENGKWDIRFENVTFAYPSSRNPAPSQSQLQTQLVLKDLTLCIPDRSSCAIVGTSGAGKSTLFKLLIGTHIPQSGKIWIGNLEGSLLRPDRRALLPHVAYVPQEPVLLDRSIFENVWFGSAPREYTDTDTGLDRMTAAHLEQVQEACRLAGLHNYIESLPMKYDSPCSTLAGQGNGSGGGEGSGTLSGGQKQRLALARAFIRRKQCKLLLMDEPTSALDDATMKYVMKAFQQEFFRRCTVLVITHHKEMMKRCNKHIYF